MALTSKQRKKLRGIANTLDPVLIIGKEDVSDGIVAQADVLLEDHELIKCTVLETSDLTAREAADELVRQTGAECVQVIGRRFTIYRRSSRDDIDRVNPDEGPAIIKRPEPKKPAAPAKRRTFRPGKGSDGRPASRAGKTGSASSPRGEARGNSSSRGYSAPRGGSSSRGTSSRGGRRTGR